MKNIYFPDEDITKDDLKFICYMIERVSRKLKQPNRYVVNSIVKEEWYRLFSLASALHCENPEKVEYDWITEYLLTQGDDKKLEVDRELVDNIPTALQMGKVYMRLISDTLKSDEDYVEAIIRVYNDPITKIIDNYNSSAYYEPSYFIARAYYNGGF